MEQLETRALLAANFTELPGGSQSQVVAFNGKTYYAGDAGLYVTDGTRRGTNLVHQFESVDLTQVISHGHLYFTADDGITGRELWRTDGTRAGTELVADINPGPESSDPHVELALRSKVFLTADDGVHGLELFVSDSTTAGRTVLTDIAQGSADSFPTSFAVGAGKRIYFTAEDQVHGSQLWVTDGSTIKFVTGLGLGDFGPGTFLTLRRITYFYKHNELWKTNGTEQGTVRVAIVGHAGGQNNGSELIESLHKLHGHLVFFVRHFSRIGEQISSSVFSSDGTAAGTTRLASFGAGSRIRGYATTRKRDIFVVNRDGRTKSMLWKTDGTPGGTTPITSIPYGAGFTMSANATEAFYATGTFGSSAKPVIWRTDGTSSGTRSLATLPRFQDPSVSPIYRNTTLFVSIDFFQMIGAPPKPTHLYVIPIPQASVPLPLVVPRIT